MGHYLDPKKKISKITPYSVAQYDGLIWKPKKKGLRHQYTEHFFVRNEYARKLYFYLYPLWLAMHIWDWFAADHFQIAPKLNFGFSTLTKNPASIGTDNPVDGFVARQSVIELIGDIRSGAGNYSSVGRLDTIDAAVYIKFDGSSNGYWNALKRFICCFDTSSLTSGATISAAVLSLYGFGKADPTTAITPNVDIYAATPANTNALADSDYGQIGATSQTGSPIPYASFATSAYNAFTFNATGIGNVSKTGISKFGTRNANYDVANSAPTWSAGSGHYMTVNASGEASNKPKLVVTYTTPVAPTVTTQAVSDIDKTTATGNGNVTDDGGSVITERGVCIGASANPDTSGTKFTASGTTGAFTAAITGLTKGNHYHVRAYAINSIGTSYGADVEFTAKTDASITKGLIYAVRGTPAAKTKSLKYTIDRAATAITKSLKYTIDKAATALTKSLKYTVVKPHAAITKGLIYEIKTTPTALTKALKYEIKTTPNAMTKGLIYRIKTIPTAMTKSLRYAIDKVTGITKGLVYKVDAGHGITKGLIYDVRAPATPVTKVLKYEIRTTPNAITKSLKYEVVITPSALTKSLKYEVMKQTSITKGLVYEIKSPVAITKSMKYSVVKTPSAITKGLIYIVGQQFLIQKSLTYIVIAPKEIQKSLKYTVLATAPAKTKSLRYEIATTSSITKSLRYGIRTKTGITKALEYQVEAVKVTTKSLKYGIRTAKQTTKSLKYEIRTISAITKQLAYTTKSQVAITKSLRYKILIGVPVLIQKSMRYEVVAPKQITKSMQYVMRVYPYKKKTSPYSKKTSPYTRLAH